MDRIVYDGDFGIDDSLALMYLAAQPDVELLAVGSVHGNTPAGPAAGNALQVLELVGLPDVPVAVGAVRPLAQDVDISALVHGEDGLGGQAAAPAGRPQPFLSAAELLVRTVRANPGEVTVVATGPLTNLALALLLDPALPGLVRSVAVMGGTLDAPGNITPYAEANIWHDPEAADLVLAAGWPLRLVGLDVTMSTWLGPGELARIAADDTARGRFALAMLQHYLAFYRTRHEREGCPLHDPTAAALALDPDLATYLVAPVRVELRSPDLRGALLVDRRAFAGADPIDRPPVHVAVAADHAGLIERLVPGFLGRPPTTGR